MNIGLRKHNDKLVPITILTERKNQIGKYIDINSEKLISKLDIVDTKSSNVIETVKFRYDNR